MISKKVTRRASTQYTCTCGCNAQIKQGDMIVVAIGGIYSVGHEIEEERDCEKFEELCKNLFESAEQTELQLF